METVRSRDGTAIAFDRSGTGPAVILVGGAMSERSIGVPLAALLEPRFTVFNDDRQRRGASGDTLPYTVEREVEDLDALVAGAGGSASVFGTPFGAILALEAACDLAIAKLALYEPPFSVDDGRRQHEEYAGRRAELLTVGRKGDVVERFVLRVGVPPGFITQERNVPWWPAMEDRAHTLGYAAAVMGDGSAPAERLARVTVPMLVIDGAETPAGRATQRPRSRPSSQRGSRTLEAQSTPSPPRRWRPCWGSSS